MNPPARRLQVRKSDDLSAEPADNDPVGRLLAAGAAVICCYLLYRLAKGFWRNYNRPGRSRSSRRKFYGRKDVRYSVLEGNEESFEDEDEGYHDSEDGSLPPLPKVNLNRPLPDKPLPPLPQREGT
ncbi:hypothetical protein BT63DRAFT_230599 [Microthyrium microscopicum]|uniref:Uncharacterized protein n=1 Tax=Microthyrium microscopicum TaxID=703497 RepID=A0A6A6UEZ0_9PEZI|nr:hypothetical protein BT63DRAFT_230599 [Microthyrium microscopicum]